MRGEKRKEEKKRREEIREENGRERKEREEKRTEEKGREEKRRDKRRGREKRQKGRGGERWRGENTGWDKIIKKGGKIIECKRIERRIVSRIEGRERSDNNGTKKKREEKKRECEIMKGKKVDEIEIIREGYVNRREEEGKER